METEIIKIQNWIKEYIESAGAKGVVVGISGGKDSLVTAKLCANAIGKENVVGIIMPNGKMKDESIAREICELLQIRYYEIDIEETVNSIIKNAKIAINGEKKQLESVTLINTPPRVRTATLYAIAGSLGYLVANTSNLSEASVGYTTKWGDNIGDFSVLGNFTKTEVCEIGLALGLPERFVNKTPDDGLSGVSDEEKLGITYDEIDKFIRTGVSENKEKLLSLYHASNHKRQGVITYDSKRHCYFKDCK